MQKRERLETALGYTFQNRRLLELALTHRSYAREQDVKEDNERLEFLGDAVLELAVSEILMEGHPDYAEGRMTKIRAQLVSADNLFQSALALPLGENLILSENEEKNGGRRKKAPLSDAMEAIIAAVHLDGGLAAARALVERLIASPARIAEADQSRARRNAKSTLQEVAQAGQLPVPVYKTVGEHGPPHERIFEVSLTLGEHGTATGSGTTKRNAQQIAAAKVLEAMGLLPAQDSKQSR